MNKLLERVGRAIRKASDEFNTPPWEWNDDVIAKAAITAICDEIDEGGIEAAYEAWASRNASDRLEFAIRAYLSHIKSTTETKGAV